MRTRLLLILLTLGPLLLQAQVINTENRRLRDNKQGWGGHFDLGFSYTQNVRQILQGNADLQAQYHKNKHTLLLLNDLRLMRVDTNAILNRGFQHVRYNYEVRPYLIPEAFVQSQYDQVWKLDWRFLVGAGPRFRFVQNDSMKLHTGILLMHEYEKVDGGAEYNQDFRLSGYISGSYNWHKKVGVDHITYFQPRLDSLADFRVSTETNLRLAVTKHLGFKLGFTMNVDMNPPQGLPTTIYTYTNAISFLF